MAGCEPRWRLMMGGPKEGPSAGVTMVTGIVSALRNVPVRHDMTMCVYILSCADGSLYTGMTNDLDRRLAEHRAGRGARWTSWRLPVELVFSLNDLSYSLSEKDFGLG